MNILGVGPTELLLVMVLALIFIGPAKLPEVAGQLGRAFNEFRRASQELQTAFSAQLAEETAALNRPADDQTALPESAASPSAYDPPANDAPAYEFSPTTSPESDGYADGTALADTATVVATDDLRWFTTFELPARALPVPAIAPDDTDLAWLTAFPSVTYPEGDAAVGDAALLADSALAVADAPEAVTAGDPTSFSVAPVEDRDQEAIASPAGELPAASVPVSANPDQDTESVAEEDAEEAAALPASAGPRAVEPPAEVDEQAAAELTPPTAERAPVDPEAGTLDGDLRAAGQRQPRPGLPPAIEPEAERLAGSREG
ncbi:MAG: twin-arginine translocase TatA/TatE family subunit [Chloroflexi bacterium]|nr:twin-arginine translocase TatA/TatE family subunit [Chloroflexota bacterium]